MMRFSLSILMLLAAACTSMDRAAADSEKDVLDALQAKRPMRCPVGSHCRDQPDVTIRFRTGSAELTGDASSTIATFVDRYRKSTGKPAITLTGFADALGPAGYNAGLSRRRALAVRRILVDRHELSAGAIDIVAGGIRHEGVVSADDRIAIVSITPRQ
jgi:outer membrane protein OmpA-like peptidoglycan-associated protein